MSESKFKLKWKDYSKLDKLKVIIFYVFTISFLIGLTYWGFFSKEIIMLCELLPDPYFILICLGWSPISILFYQIVEKIFWPQTKEELLIREKRKEFIKKYSIELTRLKVKELKTTIKLNEIKEKMEKLKND